MVQQFHTTFRLFLLMCPCLAGCVDRATLEESRVAPTNVSNDAASSRVVTNQDSVSNQDSVDNTILPVTRADIVGHWSCECYPFDGPPHGYYGNHVHFDLEKDGSYFYAVRKNLCATTEDFKGPGWKLEPIRPAEGRYLLTFGDGDEWEVRFSKDHSTMYVNVCGDEEEVIKRDKSGLGSGR